MNQSLFIGSHVFRDSYTEQACRAAKRRKTVLLWCHGSEALGKDCACQRAAWEGISALHMAQRWMRSSPQGGGSVDREELLEVALRELLRAAGVFREHAR